jgi:hypothetical protein
MECGQLMSVAQLGWGYSMVLSLWPFVSQDSPVGSPVGGQTETGLGFARPDSLRPGPVSV